MWLVRCSEYYYDNQLIMEAYNCSKKVLINRFNRDLLTLLFFKAYSMEICRDRGIIVYIACMVELGLKTELFHMGCYKFFVLFIHK